MTRRLTFVTRTSIGKPFPDDSSWDWSLGETHVCEAPRFAGIDPPMTLCDKAVVYNQVTQHGTPAGYQWANSRVAGTGYCMICAHKLAERGLTIDNVETAHTAIPDWNERKSWWP